MFSSAVSVGTRLKAWNTKPIRSRRSSVSFFSDSDESSVPPMWTWPEVSVSRPARQCINVDLPEPDGPMMAVNAPVASSTVTSSRAVTCVVPDP